ncbi:MAG: hypothetical protein V4844_21990 [Pseudomonadota bacterium]
MSVFLFGYAALLAFAVSSAVIYWRSGQTRQSWKQLVEQLREGSLWHIFAALSGVAFLGALALMRLSPTQL